jgi:hypothetical protein
VPLSNLNVLSDKLRSWDGTLLFSIYFGSSAYLRDNLGVCPYAVLLSNLNVLSDELVTWD